MWATLANLAFTTYYVGPKNYLKAPFNSELLYYFDQYSSYFSRALRRLDPKELRSLASLDQAGPVHHGH